MTALDAHGLTELAGSLPVPGYDRSRVRVGVVHIGTGGFHRAHQAMYHDRLLAAGALDWGICGVGVLPADRRMHDVLAAQDGLYTLVVKHPDGRYEPRVIGSILEHLLAPDDPEAVIEKLAAPTTHLVTLTITEGGYDIERPPLDAFALVVEAIARRRARDVAPLTVLSCDNLVDNGTVARRAFVGYARREDPELADWIDASVAFPSTVVDRITPSTTDADRDELRKRTGIEDGWPVVCEPFAQWVIEDTPGGHLAPYADAGAVLTPDVAPYEQMKLRLLNAGHQGIAYFGRLCGYTTVHEAATDPAIRAFLEAYLHEEATPTLSAVPHEQLAAFRDQVPKRFANPAIGDTLERLAYNASDRIPQFVLPVIRDQLERGGEIRRAAAIVATWARCLEGLDEQGRPIVFADVRGQELVERAGRERRDPRAFIAYRPVFGDLGDDERFVAAYVEARRSLTERGTRETLAGLA